jgi:hypothetical protein
MNKMNQGSYLILKKNLKQKLGANHHVVLYRNMRILRRKLQCDTAYFKPCNFVESDHCQLNARGQYTVYSDVHTYIECKYLVL